MAPSKSVGGEFLSPKGLIKSHWELSAATFTLDLTLPIGVASAEVTIPALGGTAAKMSITCNGKEVWSGGKFAPSAGLKSAALAPGGAGIVFETLNGVFTFTSQTQR